MRPLLTTVVLRAFDLVTQMRGNNVPQPGVPALSPSLVLLAGLGWGVNVPRPGVPALSPSLVLLAGLGWGFDVPRPGVPALMLSFVTLAGTGTPGTVLACFKSNIYVIV